MDRVMLLYKIILLIQYLMIIVTSQNIDYSKYQHMLPKGFTPSPEMLAKYKDLKNVPDEYKELLTNLTTSTTTEAPPAVAAEAGENIDAGHSVVTPAVKASSARRVKGPCRLHPTRPEIHGIITRHINEGAMLIKFNLYMKEYNKTADPLSQELFSKYYKPSAVTRVLGRHGHTLLSLAFNYDILSLQLLTFGVAEIKVSLIEEFHGCFQEFDEDEKMRIIRELVMDDFLVTTGRQQQERWLEDDNYVCQQMVRDQNGKADFIHQCCNHPDHCVDQEDNKWIHILYSAIAAMKVLFLLFGPWLVQHFMYKDSIRKTDYVVQLKTPMNKTMLVKKVRMPDDRMRSSVSQQREMRQFRKFRRLVKHIPSDEIVPVTFTKLHLQVDHRDLMSEHSVPVGLVSFMWNKFFLCGIMRHEPFRSCCQESLFGSWSPRILWLPLMKKFYCNVSWRQFMSWGHCFQGVGSLILMFTVAVPYYIRLVIYYETEDPEITKRKEFAERLGLEDLLRHNVLQYLSPSHYALIVLYVVFGLTFVLLGVLRACNPDKFDSLILSALQDLRGIRSRECARLFLAHLMLPLEKFGICGLVLGLLYWPIVLPVCLIVTVFYCIPTIYLTCRLLIQERPHCLATLPVDGTTRNRRYTFGTLSDGVSSFDSCLMLSAISPKSAEPSSPSKHSNKACSHYMQALCSDVGDLVTGLVSVVWLLTVLLMYAECFGTLIEICALMLMGAIVNAGSAANYVLLSFWLIVYMTSCYNWVYNKYMVLNKRLFQLFKDKLKDDVKGVVAMSETWQNNMAFKFYGEEEMREERRRELEFNLDDADDEHINFLRQYKTEDSIDYIHGKLHWNINSLALFISKGDVPRIPKALFKHILDVRAPGCPGPVYLCLLKATRQLLYMILYLVFVFLVVMAFANNNSISTTNQLLVTLAGGLLPFVVRFVLKPDKPDIELNNYSFEGKITEVIKRFRQSWPVYDLSFEQTRHDGGLSGAGSNPGNSPQIQNMQNMRRTHDDSAAPDVVDQHVDLFITIKDDTDESELIENLRSEPSFGSRMSIHSQRNSPEDPDNSTATAAGGNIQHSQNPSLGNSPAASGGKNNPTNASSYSSAARDGGTPQRSVSAQSAIGGKKIESPSLAKSSLPHGKSVDLVVDITRGGLPQVRSEQNKNDTPGNGLQLVSMGGNYVKMTNKDESVL